MHVDTTGREGLFAFGSTELGASPNVQCVSLSVESKLCSVLRSTSFVQQKLYASPNAQQKLCASPNVLRRAMLLQFQT